MKNLSIQLTWTIALSVLIVCTAFSGGYQLNEQGARAVGMGGAFVARASDPSAVYFNPAGLAFQKGINVLGGLSLIMPSTKFTGPVPLTTETSTESQVFTPVNLYSTYQINEDIVVGIGVFNPFGLGTEWSDTWVGKVFSIKADLQTWYINPSVGYRINDQLSVGLGVSYVYGSVKMSQNIGVANGTATLDGTAKSYNFNIGAIYKPINKLSIGLSYRSTTKLDFSGTVKYDRIPIAIPGTTIPMPPFFPGGTGKATLPMPGNLLFGAAYELMSELTVEGDVQYIQWSEYDKLAIDIQPIVHLPALLGGTQTQGPITSIKKWNDAIILRGGAEYKLDQQITLRGGLILDLSPQPPSKTEPMLPDGDRVDISLGGSYKINESLSIDAAYMLVLFMERDAKNSALKGVYNSNAHILSVNVGYSF